MMVLSTIQAKYYDIKIFDIKQELRLKLYSFAVIGAVGVPTYFIGLQYVPTSIASLIFSISPMIVAVIAPFVLDEVLTKMKVISVVGSFIGASMFALHKNSIPGEADYYYLGILLTFITCLTGATIALLMRMINKHIHFAICPVYFGFATFGVSLTLMIASPSSFNFAYYTPLDCIFFMLSGMCNFMGQTFKSIAFKYGDATVVAPFCYLEVVWLFWCDILIFSYTFAYTDLIGGIIIATCLFAPVVINLRAK